MKKNQSFSKGTRGGARRGAGRKKGIPNQSTLAIKQLVDCIFERVNPVQKAIKLLRSKSDRTQAMIFLRLLEYRYGRPSQTDGDGETHDFKKILVVDVPRPPRHLLNAPASGNLADTPT